MAHLHKLMLAAAFSAAAFSPAAAKGEPPFTLVCNGGGEIPT